jgi:alpha-1,2-mannosyltransferase
MTSDAPVRDEEDPSVQAQAELGRTGTTGPAPSRQFPWYRILRYAGLITGALLFAAALTAYVTDLVAHGSRVIDWYDLDVYNDAGLITRQLPAILYTWEKVPGVQFTYTPFAGLVFAGSSFLKLSTFQWTMTVLSMIGVPLTAWLTLGAMGRRGVARLGVALAVAAVSLWTEPVDKALFLGQIEIVLMVLVVWDLTSQDERWWKGMGIGVAAGIKLIPGIFIPYLLLTGRIRQAIVATATFLGTIVIGFIFLPAQSASYWLTGYFLRPGRTGGVDSLVNQSMLGALARLFGSTTHAQTAYLPIAAVVLVAGLAGGAMLSRSGKEVQGWVLVSITALLVSPISWDHHWVWVVPFVAMLAGMAMTSRGLARIGLIAGAIATAAVFGSWPWNWSGSQAFVPERGLLGWFVGPPQVNQVTSIHGWQLLSWNLFVAAGLVMYLAILAGVWPAWRNRSRGEPPSPPPPVTQSEATSPISALLAKADAVLRTHAPVASSDSAPRLRLAAARSPPPAAARPAVQVDLDLGEPAGPSNDNAPDS